MTFVIRPTQADDLAQISEIYAESVLTGSASYELVPPTIKEMRLRFEAISGSGHPYISVFRDDEELVGYAYAGPFRPRPAYRWTVEDSIYLSEKARGQGLGKKLLKELIVRSEQLGFRQMIAVIGGAAPASIAVHEACGFVHAGRMEATGFKHGRWLDTVTMQLSLGEGRRSLPDETSFPGTLF